jgi:hypothetical protein
MANSRYGLNNFIIFVVTNQLQTLQFIKPYQTMMQDFHPFTQEAFTRQTGLSAHDHEGVYLRWVNVQLNYQNYLSMKSMNEQLGQIVQLLKVQEVR